MHLSIAPSVLFLFTVVVPALTAPVPSPLSDTTAILAKRNTGHHGLGSVVNLVAGVVAPEVEGPLRVAEEAERFAEEVHNRHRS
ncbi:hypothetical protein FRB91_002301 [Serendipita sp. 411]|nr:hypothetical protein FRC19_001053 [Serendipita sp. 401]KAG8855371.1 hypothetical protein FRB91_002301 [Serendipita sp. 411]